MNLDELTEDNIVLRTNELPRLSMTIKKNVAGFETEGVALEAAGLSLREAEESMRFLLREAKKLQRGNK